jgi:transposase
MAIDRHAAKGAFASANLYSLLESAMANGFEPRAHMTRVFEQLPHAWSIEKT